MTSYFSLPVLGLFLPVTVIVYAAAPRRIRPFVLLAASFLFFWSISGALLAFLLFSTVSIWLVGQVLACELAARSEALRQPGARRRAVSRRFCRRMRAVLAIGVAANLGVLAALKYAPFLSGLAAPLLAAAGLGDCRIDLGIGLPIGISFYTLQAVSYLVDVYRGRTAAERNPFRLALYLAFFPQIMEGPICRYEQTAEGLWAGRPVTARALADGSLRIAWGLAKKMIVADRVNLLVKTVFSDYASYDGGVIALAAVLYTVQLYCDFSGTMDFALGAGRIFGVRLPENFRQPFLSRTASEFWTRWHITLGAWFRDYVFYPVSLSGCVKRLTSRARRVFGNRYGPLAASGAALLCVWLGNGLWHGAGGQYVLFGLYYFALIWLGGLAGPLAVSACERLGVAHEGRLWRAWQHARTLAVVFVGELIFRAASAHDAVAMLARLFGDFRLTSFSDGAVLGLGMDACDFAAVAVALAAVFAVGVARERGAGAVRLTHGSGLPARAALTLALLMSVAVFGAYGAGYVPVDPMYAQF